jgi:hypothetical protein
MWDYRVDNGKSVQYLKWSETIFVSLLDYRSQDNALTSASGISTPQYSAVRRRRVCVMQSVIRSMSGTITFLLQLR